MNEEFSLKLAVSYEFHAKESPKAPKFGNYIGGNRSIAKSNLLRNITQVVFRSSFIQIEHKLEYLIMVWRSMQKLRFFLVFVKNVNEFAKM